MELTANAMDRLIDHVHEFFSDNTEYRKSCAVYKKLRPYHLINGDCPENDAEKHILYCDKCATKSYDVVWNFCYIMDFGDEQNARLFTAARALLRWYKMTNWERLPSDSLKERILQFVLGEDSETVGLSERKSR